MVMHGAAATLISFSLPPPPSSLCSGASRCFLTSRGKWRRRNTGKEEERKPLRIYLPRGFVFGGGCGGQTETVGCDFTSRELTVKDTARKKLDPTECFPCFFFVSLEVASTGVSILGSLSRDPITPPSKRRRRVVQQDLCFPPPPLPPFSHLRNISHPIPEMENRGKE